MSTTGPFWTRAAGARRLQELAAEFACSVMPAIREIQTGGVTSYKGIGDELNKRGFKTAHGKRWSYNSARAVLLRAGP